MRTNNNTTHFWRILPGVMLIPWLLCSPVLAAQSPMESAGNRESISASTGQARQQYVPVLCYHRFGKYGAKDAYSVGVQEFTRQLEIITEEGFVPITLDQLQAGWQGTTPLPKKAMLITVDDGYKDFRKQAEPVLRKYGYPATLFIYTDFIGSRLGLSRRDLLELQAQGFAVGSHSATHPKLNKLRSGESAAAHRIRLEKELHGSRKKLQAWSKGEVMALAYPYGLWDKTVAEVATEAGYKFCFTVNPGTNSQRTLRQALKRTMILRGMRETTFRKILYTQELPVVVWQPPLGVLVAGPLTRAYVDLDPEFVKRLLVSSIQVRRGQSPVLVKYVKQLGRIEMTFRPAWTRGANLLVITAQAKKDSERYMQSRLVNVQPAQAQKGK